GLTLGEGEPVIPVFRPRKDELTEPLKSEVARQEALDRAEHWRLLYVALTRAEERLYIGGALGVRDPAPPAAGRYTAGLHARAGVGADWVEAPLWDRALSFGTPEGAGRAVRAAIGRQPALLAWLHRPAPAEERPPRPLAPSSLGEDDVADPPPDAARRAAADR